MDDDIPKVVSVLGEQPELVRELVLNSTRDWKHDLTSMSYTVVLDQACRAKPNDQTGRGVSDSNKDVFIHSLATECSSSCIHPAKIRGCRGGADLRYSTTHTANGKASFSTQA